MKIKFRYQWYDENKTILQYIAEDDWNWRDYHAGWQSVVFSFLNHDGNVHILLDFREQTRAKMPSGVTAHLNSFGKHISKKMSGYAVVLGFPEFDREKLLLNEDGTISTKDGTLYFAKDEAEAETIFAQLTSR
jgi:hypothetical protein